MNLFPFFGDIQSEEAGQMPLYTEVEWDYTKGCPVVENGTFKKVTGNEAIKTWCYKVLQVPRYKHLIYSWDYGSDLENLIGKTYSQALIRAEGIRYVEECLMTNPYILSISNIQSDFKHGRLTIACDLNTIYGNTTIQEVKISV